MMLEERLRLHLADKGAAWRSEASITFAAWDEDGPRAVALAPQPLSAASVVDAHLARPAGCRLTLVHEGPVSPVALRSAARFGITLLDAATLPELPAAPAPAEAPATPEPAPLPLASAASELPDLALVVPEVAPLLPAHEVVPLLPAHVEVAVEPADLSWFAPGVTTAFAQPRPPVEPAWSLAAALPEPVVATPAVEEPSAPFDPDLLPAVEAPAWNDLAGPLAAPALPAPVVEPVAPAPLAEAPATVTVEVETPPPIHVDAPAPAPAPEPLAEAVAPATVTVQVAPEPMPAPPVEEGPALPWDPRSPVVEAPVTLQVTALELAALPWHEHAPIEEHVEILPGNARRRRVADRPTVAGAPDWGLPWPRPAPSTDALSIADPRIWSSQERVHAMREDLDARVGAASFGAVKPESSAWIRRVQAFGPQ